MEVHQHTHPTSGETHTEKKKWTHYFWEFLMLFFAVFCGFLAENQREHYVEHQREKQYISSFLEDLNADIKQLDSLINMRLKRKNVMDSLTYLLDTPDPDFYGKQIYYYSRLLTVNSLFYNNDRTIQQLKNGGNLRLIRKQDVSDAIMAYDHQVRWIGTIISREQEYVLAYVMRMEEIFDSRVFNKMATGTFGFKMPEEEAQLLKKDKLTIQLFMNKIHFLSSANAYLIMTFRELLNKAQQTKAIIEKGYFSK